MSPVTMLKTKTNVSLPVKVGIYFLFSLANLFSLKQIQGADLPSFMLNRGLIAILLCIAMYRICAGRFSFPVSRTSKHRFAVGGIGMAMQIFGASQLPVSLYGLLNRATPVWFSILGAKKIQLYPILLISILAIAPFIIQTMNPALMMGVGSMAIATFFIASSQRKQVEGAAIDCRWLMPFPPALGITAIALILSLIFSIKISFQGVGILSGIAMTLAYWAVQPILVSAKSGGNLMVIADLIAVTLLSLGEMMLASRAASSVSSVLYLGMTVATFFTFRSK